MIDIPEISEETNFWMVRTLEGAFYGEYTTQKFIAIGWNLITSEMLKEGLTKEQISLLRAKIKQDYNLSSPGTAINKCIKFYSQVKIGDIALIVDNKKVTFARIGEYYDELDTDLTVDFEKSMTEKIRNNKVGEDIKCPYKKRRKIEIIKEIIREDKINPYLFKAIVVNRHSLSDLGEYAEVILSELYPIFVYNGKVTSTFKVKKKSAIDAITLADFISHSAKVIGSLSNEQVSVKTVLNSPGDIVLQCVKSSEAIAMMLFVYIIIFGAKFKDNEIPSVLSKIMEFVDWCSYRKTKKDKAELENEVLRMELKKAEKDIEKSEIEKKLMEQDVELKDQEIIAKKYENEKTRRELEDPVIVDSISKLPEVAKQLEIEYSDNKTIDILKIIELQRSLSNEDSIKSKKTILKDKNTKENNKKSLI